MRLSVSTVSRWRFVVAVSLFAVLGIITSVRTLIAPFKTDDLSYAKYVKIISPVKSQIPLNTDISFVCAGNSRMGRDARKSGSLTECESRFVMAQAVLAPRRVINQIATDLVVGDFAADFDYREFASSNELEILNEFSDGIVLFKRKS